jgi:hypothetical protein
LAAVVSCWRLHGRSAQSDRLMPAAEPDSRSCLALWLCSSDHVEVGAGDRPGRRRGGDRLIDVARSSSETSPSSRSHRTVRRSGVLSSRSQAFDLPIRVYRPRAAGALPDGSAAGQEGTSTARVPRAPWPRDPCDSRGRRSPAGQPEKARSGLYGGVGAGPSTRCQRRRSVEHSPVTTRVPQRPRRT